MDSRATTKQMGHIPVFPPGNGWFRPEESLIYETMRARTFSPEKFSSVPVDSNNHALLKDPDREIGRKRKQIGRQIFIRGNNLPRYDEEGRYMCKDGTRVLLCDCLRVDCSGCHYPCERCQSRRCGPACQKNREMVIEKIAIYGTNVVIRENPFDY